MSGDNASPSPKNDSRPDEQHQTLLLLTQAFKQREINQANRHSAEKKALQNEKEREVLNKISDQYVDFDPNDYLPIEQKSPPLFCAIALGGAYELAIGLLACIHTFYSGHLYQFIFFNHATYIEQENKEALDTKERATFNNDKKLATIRVIQDSMFIDLVQSTIEVTEALLSSSKNPSNIFQRLTRKVKKKYDELYSQAFATTTTTEAKHHPLNEEVNTHTDNYKATSLLLTLYILIKFQNIYVEDVFVTTYDRVIDGKNTLMRLLIADKKTTASTLIINFILAHSTLLTLNTKTRHNELYISPMAWAVENSDKTLLDQLIFYHHEKTNPQKLKRIGYEHDAYGTGQPPLHKALKNRDAYAVSRLITVTSLHEKPVMHWFNRFWTGQHHSHYLSTEDNASSLYQLKLNARYGGYFTQPYSSRSPCYGRQLHIGATAVFDNYVSGYTALLRTQQQKDYQEKVSNVLLGEKDINNNYIRSCEKRSSNHMVELLLRKIIRATEVTKEACMTINADCSLCRRIYFVAYRANIDLNALFEAINASSTTCRSSQFFSHPLASTHSHHQSTALN